MSSNRLHSLPSSGAKVNILIATNRRVAVHTMVRTLFYCAEFLWFESTSVKLLFAFYLPTQQKIWVSGVTLVEKRGEEWNWSP